MTSVERIADMMDATEIDAAPILNIGELAPSKPSEK